MNIRALQYLVAVADHSHFGKAANACFVSQPTLSIQLKKLEDELGVQLFERNNKRVLITEVGRVIADRARDVLQSIKGIKETVQIIKNPYSGQVKMGIIPTLAPYLLPNIIPKLSEVYPDLTLLLVEARTAEIVAQLKKGELDVIILALPIEDKQLTTVFLFDEEFLFAVPKDHPYADHPSISLADLSGQTLLLLEEGHCLRGQALVLCQQNNATEEMGFRATSLETLRHMVAAGSATTLIPKLAVRNDNSTIRYIPFKEPIPSRPIGMLWRQTSARTHLFNEIIKLICFSTKGALALGASLES